MPEILVQTVFSLFQGEIAYRVLGVGARCFKASPDVWHRCTRRLWACPGRCLQLTVLQSQPCGGQVRLLPRPCSAASSEGRWVEGLHSRQVGEQAFYSGRFEPNMGFWHTTPSAARACAEESDSFFLLEKTLKSQFSSSTVMGPPLSGGLLPSCGGSPESSFPRESGEAAHWEQRKPVLTLEGRE